MRRWCPRAWNRAVAGRSSGPCSGEWIWGLSATVLCIALAGGLPVAGFARDVRVEAALEEATKLHEAGDSEGALGVLRKTTALIRKEKGASDPDLLPILDMAGLILFEQEKLAEAEGPLSKAVALREPLLSDRPGQFDVEQASTLLLLGKLHASAGRLDQMVDSLVKAVVMFDSALGAEHERTLQARGELVRAVDLFTQQLGPNHEATIKANEELAKVHEALGDYAAAVATLRARYDGEVQHGGPGAGATLRAAAALGRVLALEGKEDDAIAVMTQAAEAAEAARTTDAVALVELLRQIAELHADLEDYSPAEAALGRAHEIDARADGGVGVEAAVDDLLVDRLAALQGDFDPAENGFARATARFQELAQAGDHRAGRGLRLAGDACREAGLTNEAAGFYKAALEADERIVGPQDACTAEDQLGMGRCLLASGDAEGARPLLEQAAKTLRRKLGPAHPSTLAAMVALASATVKAGQADAAAEMVGRLIDRRVPREGRREDEELARVVDGAAGLLAAAGRGKEAEKLRGDFLRLRVRQFGEDHPYVADTYVNLANARQAANAWGDALALYRQGVERREAVLGESHPDVAAALLPMARTHRALKQHAEAVALLRRALAIWENAAGPDHPVTLATVKQLALAQLAAGDRPAAVASMERLLAAYEQDPETPPDDVVKLLSKLAELKHALGEDDAARRHVRRAAEIETSLAGDATTSDQASDLAELARVQRMLGDEEAAQANLQTARAIADQLADSQAKLQEIEAIASRPAAPQDRDRGNSDDAAATSVARPEAGDRASQAATLTTSRVVEDAWKAFTSGKPEQARAMVEAALGKVMSGGRGEEPIAADLLMTLADMRDTPLDTTAYEQYGRALAIREKHLGPEAAPTLVAALRTVGMLLLADPPAAERLVETVGERLSGAEGDRPAVAAAVRHAGRIAVAVRNPAVAARLADMLVFVGDAATPAPLLEALEATADIARLPEGATAATSLRSRLLLRGTNLVKSGQPGFGRMAYHHGLAEQQAGRPSRAEEFFRKALAADEQEHGEHHPLVALDMLRLADLSRKTAATDPAAAEWLGKSRAASLEMPTKQAATWADALRRLVELHDDRGEADDALRIIKAAVDAAAAANLGTSAQMAELLGERARAHLARGDRQRASEILSAAVGVATAAAGGGSAEAVSLATRLERVRGRTAATGPKVSEATALSAAADDALAVGDLVAARERLVRLGKLVWKERGKDDPAVAAVALRLADLAIPCGDLAYARTMLASVKNPGSPLQAAELQLLAARLSLAMGDSAAAAAEFEVARESLAETIGTADVDDPTLAAQRVRLKLAAAEVQAALGDAAGARSECRAIRSALAGQEVESPLGLAVLSAEVERCLEDGDAAAAIAVANEAEQAARAAAAENGVLGIVAAAAARAEQAAGMASWSDRGQAAVKLLEPVLAGMGRNTSNAAAIAAVHHLALVQAAAGDLDEAQRLSRMALAAAERSLPATHAERIATTVAAARVAAAAGKITEAETLLTTAAAAARDRCKGIERPTSPADREWEAVTVGASTTGPRTDG